MWLELVLLCLLGRPVHYIAIRIPRSRDCKHMEMGGTGSLSESLEVLVSRGTPAFLLLDTWIYIFCLLETQPT